ncbi:transcription factor Clamp-like isoform X2 [Culicoides brevitarsis]|uniref:transcription factor Clamp-like isoform X2 n=1 Tax=Culicoides brevitarsis TaxID=469753 RepID=UPI00307B24EE
MEDITKNIIFTTNNLQGLQYQTIQAGDVTIKQPKMEKQEFPTFCYVANSNMIQKITPTSQMSNVSTVNLAQLTTDDNKTVQYIAQPLGYANYAVLNPMQLQNGMNAITVDGRQLIVNKPITNTISFKCDICNMMFAHLTLLNHHKRSHHQQESDSSTNDQQQQQQQQSQQQQQITVVTQPQMQGIVQQDLLGQIQIVATESLEPAQNTQTMHQNDIQIQPSPQITIQKQEKTSKCVSCGTQVAQTGKRKASKQVRCENCSNESNAASNQRQTQIFVAPDGDIKFEISEIQGENSMEAPIQMTQQQQQSHNHSNSHHSHTSPAKLPGGAHPVKKRNTGTVTKCNKCNGSGVIFIGGAKKTQQQQQNEKPFSCSICGGRFSRYSSLWSHKKLHSGEKNYKCGVCGIAFAKAVYLKNHTRIHTGEKPYKCGTCGMQFSQSPHLKNHERTHSGEKPYVCEVCDKGFARHATLWNHRRIHTGEKPYKCDRCQSAFSQAAHLKNHEKVHSGIKPFKCDICSAAFADRFALKRHRNIHEKYGQIPNSNSSANKDEVSQDGSKMQEIVM